MKKLSVLVCGLVIMSSGIAAAQSVGNPGMPGRANTTDPNSAPVRTYGDRPAAGVDAAGRANTSDPNSAMSSGTNASGRTADPLANRRER